MANIHEKGIQFNSRDLNRLNEGAIKQQTAVFKLFQQNKDRNIPVFEIKETLHLRRMVSTRRATTNLSYDSTSRHASKNQHKDQYGQAPIVKTDVMVWNEDDTAKVHTWKWNKKYNKPPKKYGIDRNGQADAFGRPQPKHQGAYSGAGQ